MGSEGRSVVRCSTPRMREMCEWGTAHGIVGSRIEPPSLSLTFPPRQLVQDSDVDIAPSAGIAAAFGRWLPGRPRTISDDLVKGTAGEIRQLTLYRLDVVPQRVGR